MSKAGRRLFPNLEERSAKAAGKQSQGDAKQERSAKGIGKHHHTSARREPNTTIYLFIVNVLDDILITVSTVSWLYCKPEATSNVLQKIVF
jgi:hypothetical protein